MVALVSVLLSLVVCPFVASPAAADQGHADSCMLQLAEHDHSEAGGRFPQSLNSQKPVEGEVITRWNEIALQSVRNERLGAAAASRTYAMVNVAMYVAVLCIDGNGGFATKDFVFCDAHHPSDGQLAAAVAARTVLVGLFPTNATQYDHELHKNLAVCRSRCRKNTDRTSACSNAEAWGHFVGERVVFLREDDGSSPAETLEGGTGAGVFRADWTSAQYRNMRPFVIKDKSVYRSEGPPALQSREYAAAHTEVRLLGDAGYANQEYDEIFNFWKGGSGSSRPPGEWIKIAMVVAQKEGTTRELSSTARLFALLATALADSTITAWDSKFTYRFWRPATAIREASTDENPNTIEVPSWIPRNGGIGGSPEHTSGQSTYAGAGSTILAAFYGRDLVEFCFTGDDAIAGPRQFSSFSEAAAEAGRARIFAGIHFEFSNQAGQKAGRGVGAEVFATAVNFADRAAALLSASNSAEKIPNHMQRRAQGESVRA